MIKPTLKTLNLQKFVSLIKDLCRKIRYILKGVVLSPQKSCPTADTHRKPDSDNSLGIAFLSVSFTWGWILRRNWGQKSCEFSSLLFTVTSPNWFYSLRPPSLSKSGLKRLCYVNSVLGNLKSEIMPRNLPQRKCMFMNSVSVRGFVLYGSTVGVERLDW